MKIGFKIGATVKINKEFSEQELYDMNKNRLIDDEDLKLAIEKALWERKRNFHLVIKEKGVGKRVDWNKKLSEDAKKRHPLIAKFINGFNRTAKVKFMVAEEIEKLKGNENQILTAIEKSINAGIYSLNYVKTILKSIRDKDEIETQSVQKEQNIAQEALKTLRDY